MAILAMLLTRLRRLRVWPHWVALCLGGCVVASLDQTDAPAPREPFALARRATPEDLIPGLTARGKAGDYLLANDLIKVIVTDIAHPTGGSRSGGNIVDACDRRTHVDALNEVFTYFDDTFPRQAVYAQIAIERAGSPDCQAAIQVTGHDSNDAAIKVATTYSLVPSKPYVEITTALTNTSNREIREFDLGDSIQWGLTEHFAPGLGHALAGRRPRLAWLASTGPGASYGMCVSDGKMATRHGRSWSDVIVSAPDLAAGATATYTRYFVVGIGGTTAVSSAAYDLRGAKTGTLRGQIVAHAGRVPLADAALEIFEYDGTPVGVAKADPQGRYAARLPQAAYRVRAVGTHRSPSPLFEVHVLSRQDVRFSGELGEPGRVRLLAVDDQGARTPAKFTFLGREPTPDPCFGPKYVTSGAGNVVFAHTGAADTHIAPGSYLVTTSRGIEYTIDQHVVHVASGSTQEVHARIKRVVPTPGYLAADLHQHSAPSFDSATPLRDRVICNVCEGVEIVAATDHDVHTDLSPVIEKLGLRSHVKSLVGNEVTTERLGHFNAYPMPYISGHPKHGAIDHLGKTAEEIFAALGRLNPDAVIQVNHPRARSFGYFKQLRLDPSTGRSPDPAFCLGFDAIEVLNGKHLDAASLVLKDWFNLLNLGHRFTGLGGSDSHAPVTQEAGCPRTLLFVGTDSPDRVTDDMVAFAIRVRRRAIVTNGPVVRLFVNETTPIGGMVSDADGNVDVHVRVFCAAWVKPEQLELIRNGQVVSRFAIPVTEDVLRLDERVSCPVACDSWFVAVVSGGEPLAPVMPSLGSFDVTPFAFTNPIWVDADGDGVFTAPSRQPGIPLNRR